MDMISAQLRLYDFNSFSFAEASQNFAYFSFYSAIDDLSREFGSKYYVVFAISFCMS